MRIETHAFPLPPVAPCIPSFLTLVHFTHTGSEEILKKARLTTQTGAQFAGRLIPYGTNDTVLVEPNRYECGMSSVVFGFGMSPHQLGVDIEQYVGVWPPVKQLFKQLNHVLAYSTGGGRACRLKVTDLSAAECFSRTDGTWLIHCRWAHSDNRDEDLKNWDWDSNYEHCARVQGSRTLMCLGG